MFLAKFWNSEANRKAPEAQSQSAAALESKEIEIAAARTFSPPPPPSGSLSSAEALPGYPHKNSNQKIASAQGTMGRRKERLEQTT